MRFCLQNKSQQGILNGKGMTKGVYASTLLHTNSSRLSSSPLSISSAMRRRRLKAVTVSACAAANGSKEKDGVLGHVLLLKIKAGAVSRERLHEHALIGYRTKVCQSADEA